MARKKTKTNQAKIAARRLVEDEEVQKQLRLATVRVREAWSRASGRPASKSISDRKVYDKVREAATSLASAGTSLRRQPEPRHTARNVAVGAAVAGGAAYALKKKRGTGGNAPEYQGQTVAAPPAPFPGAPLPVA